MGEGEKGGSAYKTYVLERQNDGSSDFQNAAAAVAKRCPILWVTGDNSYLPGKVGVHRTVRYSTLARRFSCDTV
jgi:hypothetical protein